MARRNSFDSGNHNHNAGNSCVRCGEGFNKKAGTQRVNGSLFTAEGEAVYHKNKELQGERGPLKDFPRGKYCPTCHTDYEKEGQYQADRSGDFR